MKVIQEKTIYQLAFMPRFFPVNCYLVEEERELTLVDCALSYHAKAILHAAKVLNKPITRIVLSHAHSDHVGALDSMKRFLPDADVYISKREAKILQGDVTLEENEGKLPIKGGIPKNIKTKPDFFIQDGEKIGSLRVVSTPGHTPGSMSFIDERHHLFIVGDAFQSKGGFAVTGEMRPLFPFPALATWNKKLAIESARHIQDLKPNLIACGHGKMVYDPHQVMKLALIKAENNLYKKGDVTRCRHELD
jgi:glyoxylase-like metal-dependent hydrolase (beta-lactamase superfamily II)